MVRVFSEYIRKAKQITRIVLDNSKIAETLVAFPPPIVDKYSVSHRFIVND